MSEINMNKDGFYGSGGAGSATPIGGGGVGSIWGKLTLLELNQNKILSRLNQLENVRDEPYDVMDSFRSSKIECDAGEPANRYFVDCLKENARLIEDNDVIKYQYETMHKETVRCKDQIEQLQKTIADKQKVLEDVMDQRDRFNKENYKLRRELEDVKKSNEYLRGTFKNYEEKIAELEKMNSNQKGIITDYKDQKKRWDSMNGEYTNLRYTVKEKASTILELETANKYWENLVEKLQNENSDLKWRCDYPTPVDRFTAHKCLNIVTKIKNDPLTTVSTYRNWMVAICEDIEKTIKQEFGLK